MRRLLAAVALTALAACASTDASRRADAPTPNPHEKVGARYKIKGRWYQPRHQPDYDERGIASWYGTQFHGRLTANGEVFDMNRLTAAHKTLPLPSLVRVRNLDNGREAVLRVNDRGPFSGERIIDLSRAAADRLGTRQAGLGRVRVEYLGPAPMEEAIVRLGQPERRRPVRQASREAERPAARPVRAVAAPSVSVSASDLEPEASGHPSGARIDIVRTSPAADKAPILSRLSDGAPERWFVQVGAYTDAGNAARAAGRLPEAVPIALTTDASGLSRLRIGPYADEFPAREALRVAHAAGFADAAVVAVR